RDWSSDVCSSDLHLEFVEFVLESVQCAREFGQALEVRLVVGGHLLVLVSDLRTQLVHPPFDRGQFLLRRSRLSTGELRPRCPIRRGGSTVGGSIRDGAGRGGPGRGGPTRGGATGTIRGPALLFGPQPQVLIDSAGDVAESVVEDRVLLIGDAFEQVAVVGDD